MNKKKKPLLSRSDVLFLDRLRNGVTFDNFDFFRAFWQGGIAIIIGVATLWCLVFFTTGRNLFATKKLDTQIHNCHNTNNNSND